MSRPASALNPGQTNKKFVYLALGLGFLGAILVYAAFSRSGGSSSSSGGDRVPVVVAKTDIEARTNITASMVEVKLLPSSDASALVYSDASDVVGKTTRFPIAANEQILSGKIVDLTGASPAGASKSLAFVVPAGKRAISITVKEVSAAGGLILPGDFVDVICVYDVYFPKPNDPSQREKVDAYYIETILQGKQVLAVKQSIVDGVPSSDQQGSGTDAGTVVRNSEGSPQPDAQTITLALSPEDAQKIYAAEMNGHIRLDVRPYGDNEEKPIDSMINSDLLPRNLPNPFAR
jgi:pilus assembly protein CpaB